MQAPFSEALAFFSDDSCLIEVYVLSLYLPCCHQRGRFFRVRHRQVESEEIRTAHFGSCAVADGCAGRQCGGLVRNESVAS